MQWSYIYEAIYQSEKGPHITTMNLNLGLGDDPRREELMAIEDLLVWVVSDCHLDTRREKVGHISNNSPHNKRVWWHLYHKPSCNVVGFSFLFFFSMISLLRGFFNENLGENLSVFIVYFEKEQCGVGYVLRPRRSSEREYGILEK